MTSRTCSRCLLSDEVPGVSVSEAGLCSVCLNYDKEWGNWEQSKSQKAKELEHILEGAKRKKGLYDVLVPLSGGKDSTYILYLCRRVYNLKCLAVTWDNGFLTDHARENIRRACETLGVDHLYYGMDRDRLMKLYRFAFLKTGFFCPVCLQGMSVAIERTQLGFEIPLAVKGTSRRTEEHVSPEFFLEGGISFIENLFAGTEWEQDVVPMLRPAGIFSAPRSVKLPDYIEWDYKTIFETIKRELGWKAHSEDAEHSDCKVDNIVNYIRYRKYPSLIPEMLRFSKLITVKQLSREEALARVSKAGSEIKEPEDLGYFLESLAITREDMEKVLADRGRHFPYLRHNSGVKRRLANLKRRILNRD